MSNKELGTYQEWLNFAFTKRLLSEMDGLLNKLISELKNAGEEKFRLIQGRISGVETVRDIIHYIGTDDD